MKKNLIFPSLKLQMNVENLLQRVYLSVLCKGEKGRYSEYTKNELQHFITK